MRPPWHPHQGNPNAAQRRKIIKHEALRKRVVVKRRPDTELEKLFMSLQYEQLKDMWRKEGHWRSETIAAVDINADEPISHEEIVQAAAAYSVKPQRGRKIIMEINGEFWASARWLFFNLEYSIGFDSLTSWLAKYRTLIRRKKSPDGHIWLYHLEGFKEWRKKSVELQVRNESVKAKMREARL